MNEIRVLIYENSDVKKRVRGTEKRSKREMDNRLIDLDELMEIMDHDQVLVKECFNDFINDSGIMLKKIKDAIGQENRELLEKTAHALKGSLRYLAANPASDMAFTLEKIGMNGHMGEACDAYEALAEECRKLIEWMQQYKFSD